MKREITKRKIKVLTRSKVRAWLESKSPNSVIGVMYSCTLCPIAQFLQETINKQISVTGEYAYLSTKHSQSLDEEYNLPKWTTKFITQVDLSNGSNITKEQALYILDVL